MSPVKIVKLIALGIKQTFKKISCNKEGVDIQFNEE